MAKYAVVKIGGSQYKVSEGDTIEVANLPQKEGDKVNFEDVLLLVNDNKVEIGQPVLKDVVVGAKILSFEKGDKIRVARFRAKSRYRKVKGFRASLTKIQIDQIGAQEKTKKVEEKVEPKSITAKKTSRGKVNEKEA